MRSDQTRPMPEDEAPKPPRPAKALPRRSRSVTGMVLISALDMVVLLLIAALLAWLLLTDRDLPLPAWAEDRIEARLAAAIAPGRGSIGAIKARVDRRGRASVQIADLTLKTFAGATLATLPKIAVTFDRDALWRGEIRPATLSLEGADLRLRRDRAGRFEFGFDTGGPAPIGSPQAALQAIEEAFAGPGLDAITAISVRGVTLDYRDDRAARAWVIEDGTLDITQDAERLTLDLSVAIPGAGPAARLGLNLITDKGAPTAQLAAEVSAVPAADIAAHAPALSWLAPVAAPVSGSLATQMGADGTLGSLDGTLQIGPGEFAPQGGADPVPFETLRTAFAYRPEIERLTFDAFELRSGPLELISRGHVLFEGLATGWPTALIGQVQIDRVTVDAPEILEAGVTFTDGAADVKITADPFTAQIGQLTLTATQGQITAAPLPSMVAARLDPSPPAPDRTVPPRRSPRPVANPARGGPRPSPVAAAPPVSEPAAGPKTRPGPFRILARGALAAGPQGWTTAIDLEVPEATPQDVLALWPVNEVVLTRTWLGRSLIGGRVVDARAAIRLAPEQEPRIAVGFGFQGAEVRVLPNLPPVTEGRGFASIERNRFALTVAEGTMRAPQGGDVDVAGSTMVLDDIRKKPPDADIQLTLDGPIPAVLSVLDQPPFRFLTKAGQPVDLAQGHARVEGSLVFALARRIQVADVEMNVDAVLTDVSSETLIRGKRLAAERLALVLRPDRLEIAGPVTIDGVPAEATYTQPLGQGPQPATVTGTIEIGARAVETFRLGLPANMVSGSGQADMAITLPKGAPPRFRLISSLGGVGLSLPPLGWRMGAGATGRLEVAGQFTQPPVIERLALTAPGLQLDGDLTLRPGGGLEALRLSELKVGRWLDAPVTLRGRGAGRAPAVTVSGGRADLRGLIAAGSGGGGAAGAGGAPLAIALDRLSINDSIALTALRGDLTTSGGLQGNFTARVNGGARIAGRLTPGRGGRPALRIDGDNAGSVLASSGLFDKGQGGEMALVLTPSADDGVHDGQLRVRNVRVQSAPGLAAMLNAISVVGLLDQLNGAGLLFSDVQAVFRLTPRAVQVISSSGTGPSVGITMEGVYDMARDQLNMQGVFSPAYALNAIGQIFTRRGEGLLGLTYTMRGSAKGPQVVVNPLSAFTPGMFREIFRAPPPRLPGD